MGVYNYTECQLFQNILVNDYFHACVNSKINNTIDIINDKVKKCLNSKGSIK